MPRILVLCFLAIVVTSIQPQTAEAASSEKVFSCFKTFMKVKYPKARWWTTRTEISGMTPFRSRRIYSDFFSYLEKNCNNGKKFNKYKAYQFQCRNNDVLCVLKMAATGSR